MHIFGNKRMKTTGFCIENKRALGPNDSSIEYFTCRDLRCENNGGIMIWNHVQDDLNF